MPPGCDGSLLLASGPAARASLLPEAYRRGAANQLVPDLNVAGGQRRRAGQPAPTNVVLISGPSRTADIAGETVMGVHGPGAVQIVLLSEG